MFSMDWRREALGTENPLRSPLQGLRLGYRGAGFRDGEEGKGSEEKP